MNVSQHLYQMAKTTNILIIIAKNRSVFKQFGKISSQTVIQKIEHDWYTTILDFLLLLNYIRPQCLTLNISHFEKIHKKFKTWKTSTQLMRRSHLIVIIILTFN